MNFASITFLYYFLPLVLVCYYLVPGRNFKNLILLSASLVFYAWGEGLYLFILLGSILCNHLIGRQLQGRAGGRWLAVGIVFNLGLLISFKYLVWFLGGATPSSDVAWYQHLPLGISFFTFQAMSMLVDIRRGQKPGRHILDTGLYIAMFPQLIAGPIVRFNEIRADIIERRESFDRFAAGCFIFVLGLGQKVLIADNLAIPADSAFATDPAMLSMGAAWFGLICFSLQIFFDFAGYSNMAIGLGRFFGFELPRNFDFPYSAASFREFWRRWHMTLSRWFRDYLYIPLGGSRGGSVLTYRNLLIVFILCGLWHGAAWTFLLWGLWHGVFLICERLNPWRRVAFPRILGVIYVCLFVSLGWVLFRADHLGHALSYWQALGGFGGESEKTAIDVTRTSVLIFILALFFTWDQAETVLEKIAASRYLNTDIRRKFVEIMQWGFVIGVFFLCFLSLSAQTHQAFIYFRF